VVVIILTVSIRTEGIDATSFMTGENPTNDEKAALTNATAAAIDEILKNRGDSTELSSVSVSSVDDSSKCDMECYVVIYCFTSLYCAFLMQFKIYFRVGYTYI
jgi:hypothetical protein